MQKLGAHDASQTAQLTINYAQITDKPVFSIFKTIAEKAVCIDKVAAEEFDEASPRANTDIVAFAQYDRLNVRLFLNIVEVLYISTTMEHHNGLC
jgi:hypothetical protein